MEFICKFEMHPITQLGCIVSIYGTQASWGNPERSHHIGWDLLYGWKTPAWRLRPVLPQPGLPAARAPADIAALFQFETARPPTAF